MKRFFSRAAASAFVLAFAAACGGETPAATEVTVQGPVSFVIVSGDNQTGPAGDELPQPVVVRAEDASGNPIAGRHVGFAVVRGGGEMFVGGGVTDANGIVKDYWTLGSVVADSQRIEARSVDPATGAKQVFGVFRATAVPGAPASLVALTTPPSAGWTRPVRSQILDSVRVAVADRFGNRVTQAGIPVQWLPSHGGNVTTSSGIVPTDAQGVSTTVWRLGSVAGPQTLSVSVNGSAPKLVYQATATPQSPSIVRFSADSLNVNALRQILPYSVTATDVYGNPVPYTLSTLNPTIVGIENGNTLRSLTNGVARVVVTAGSKADTLVVTVQQKAASIAFRAYPTTVAAGGTMPFDWFTVVRDSNNQQVPNLTGIWSSTNPAVASVNATGTVTLHAPGTFKIVVSKDGVTRETETITVTP
jgi:hypothetical protein